jgi:hypothetical protein
MTDKESRRPAEFPLQVLREYALLADGERGILVGPRGDFAWMCAPPWDSGAVFSSLIGGGMYAVTPVDHPFVWGGYYEQNTLIWHSRWVTNSQVLECREALAAARRRRQPGPARQRPLARSGDHRRGHREAGGGQRRRHLRTGQPPLGAFAADLRGRAARHRRARPGQPGRSLEQAGRCRADRRLRRLPAPGRPLAARSRRRAHRRRAAAAADPRRAGCRGPAYPGHPGRGAGRAGPRGQHVPLPARRTTAGDKPRARSCSAASPPPWPCTSRAVRSRRTGGSNATGPPADPRACWPRNTTSGSGRCAATCPRPSCTRCCWRRRSARANRGRRA